MANGVKSTSNVLCFQHQSSGKPYHLAYTGQVIAASLSHKGHLETAIAHPFGLAFDQNGHCYVSNQDTNVVARVTLGANGASGNLGAGCWSARLQECFPSGVFLNGTLAASHNGDLHHVKIPATNMPASPGGLAVKPDSSSKVLHSVRDVAIAPGLLKAALQRAVKCRTR